jgi:hypothetical protein
VEYDWFYLDRWYSVEYDWFYLDRWYSVEYDWFYLESLTTSFKFRASSSATGDTRDMINTGSPVNGSPFTMTGACVNLYGPWWYTAVDYCCYCRLLGPSGVANAFSWDDIGDLKSARMLIRLSN